MSSKRRTTGKSKTKRTSGRAPAFRVAAPALSPAQAAEECVRLAEQYPEDQEDLLREAAEAWSDAGEHERALALYERLLDPQGGGCREPDLVDALRISALWDAGRGDEARAAAAAFRRRHPRDGGAWTFVAEAFESEDGAAAAAPWFTAGIAHVLGAGTPVTTDTVEESSDGSDGFDVETLLIGRHRVRRLLGEAHDDWDDVADELHQRRASPLHGRMRPLDELHDPVRLARLADGGPDALAAEFEELADALAEDGTLHSPPATCLLFWPQEEFVRLLQRWPSAASSYGDDHAGHLRQVERTLRELSDQGGTHLAVGRATVSGLEAYARSTGESAAAAATWSAYAAELARGGQAVYWPPPRNGPCWCGSARKYKKCCGNPALG
ncbi:SEC-C domain-containing protein [Streptomyces sp. NPDC048297]|uniref:SEC-C domain-containing protein n=1 Tax=Streptomyces sp. NPDC048297 TaxID=3365531 RepID=UPI00372471EE